MADPVSYSVSYSFSGFQASNPATPLPAVSLDAEFAALEASVTSIATALAEVRRSDGNLQNGTVTYDVLSADVQELIAGSALGVNIGQLSSAAFATQTEAEAGVANDKLMTPLRVAEALDALRGFASQSQAEAGTNTATVMSPLRAKQLVDSARAYASQAQAEAGTNNTAVMTALRVAEALAALRPALTATADLTWGAIAAGASADQTIAVTGAQLSDRVLLGLPDGLSSGLIPFAWVSASDVVKVRIHNITASPITPHSGAATAYAVTAVRF